MDWGTPNKAVVAATLAALLGGCGSELEATSGGGGDGAGHGKTGAGAGGDPGAGGAGGDLWSSGPGGPGAGGAGAGSGQGAGSGAGGDTACAGVTAEAALVPLDMYIMLDKSGSMGDETGPLGSGPTKWQAITQALGAFFAASASSGIGVGLQFFPLMVPNVPATCTSHAQCGEAGPCILSACDGETFVLPCATNADCGASSGQCAPLGTCSNAPNYHCFYNHPFIGPDCGFGPGGNYLGTCQALLSSTCANPLSCSAAQYAAPAVEIQPLSTGTAALLAAIGQTWPDGMTPTAPALSGLIAHTKEWAVANPQKRVVAVLATDGMPTECNPQSIGQIAQIAANGMTGSTPVQTFVIGVFSPNDSGAQQNLDQIAVAGGTEKAFFIADDENVTEAFLAALEAIQGKSLACEYLVPEAPPGEDLAYDEVNVEHAPEGQDGHTIPYVGEPGACDPADGGWYYDKDPNGAAAPTKILMCPATCGALQGNGGKLSIRLGCKTIVPEPK